MVAISLYRGNLHRVPDVPRRWLMPAPGISLKDFKSLLNRRSKALSLLRSPNLATTSNPNPSTDPIPDAKLENGAPIPIEEPQLGGAAEDVEKDRGGGSDGGDRLGKLSEVYDKLAEEKDKDVEAGNSPALEVKEADGPGNPNAETTEKEDMLELDDKEKRKREVEEKLQVLQAKKHNLVQALKQILNVEEQLKAKKDPQVTAGRLSGPLQVDVTNDSGSMSRQVTPRMGSEANVGGDGEAGEAEDASNLNIHSRHMHRTSSLSPSSESPLRRPSYFQHNVVPHPSRSSWGTTGSPSRFAPTGHQGNPSNLPSISVSGTNYIASSPSPAASGGTSAFRDARQPSPWN